MFGMGLGVTMHRKPAVAGSGEPSEFITNGVFAADTNWTKGAGWTISGGAANNTEGFTNALSQNFGELVQPLINGNDYVLSFDLTNLSLQAVGVTLSGGVSNQIVYFDGGNGPISIPFTATDARTTIHFQTEEGQVVSVDNVSLVPAP